MVWYLPSLPHVQKYQKIVIKTKTLYSKTKREHLFLDISRPKLEVWEEQDIGFSFWCLLFNFSHLSDNLSHMSFMVSLSSSVSGRHNLVSILSKMMLYSLGKLLRMWIIRDCSDKFSCSRLIKLFLVLILSKYVTHWFEFLLLVLGWISWTNCKVYVEQVWILGCTCAPKISRPCAHFYQANL